ncbi:MAG TPA: hypothetical protein VIG24_07915 [Acidimicrobiia bacterium]
MTYRVQVAWGHLRKGAVASASDLAGCNITMLLARGVLTPVVPKKTKKAPAQPVEPEEL